MGFGGSGGGSSSIASSNDVALSSPENKDVLSFDSVTSKWKNTTVASSANAQIVVRWNSTTDQWATRPSDAEFGVVFLSTNDPTATPPTDMSLRSGDVWRRHPDAV